MRTSKYEKSINELREKNPFISNTELVYMVLRDNIVDHRIAPGQKLNQEQIAVEMNVSRTPVRDAFAALEKEGFLEKGVQGYTVYEMQPGDYVALLEVRIALEKLAARLACSQMLGSERSLVEKNLADTEVLMAKGIGRAWDEDINIINESQAKQLFHALGEKDHEFHIIIMNAAHNQYLVESYMHIDPKIHFFRFSALNAGACQNMLERHKKIYDAIRQRDEDLAERRMEKHLMLTVSRAMRY
ncbi:MAG TPA: hypothetical protein DD735_11595 [Clostridiales bacterium]|nr:hypothetical protein [Clostridiales bacterium]